MSPVDPFSPTSLPSTPTSPLSAGTFEAINEFRATSPPRAPSIAPTLHLPRLITSFNSSFIVNRICSPSRQHSLPTPSPLALRQSPQTPRTAIKGQTPIPTATEADVQRRGRSGRSHKTSTSSSSDVSDFVLPSPVYRDGGSAHKELPAISPAARVRSRQVDAMGDLGARDSRLTSPTIEQIVRLPLRTSTSSSPRSILTPLAGLAVEGGSDSALSQTGRRYSSTKRSIQVSTPRSPIHKRVRTQNHSAPASGRQVQPQSQSYRRRRKYSSIHRRMLAFSSIDKDTKLVIRTHFSASPTAAAAAAASTAAATRARFTAAVAHLATPLVPLISVRTGLAHPYFPRSLLQYHLLTHEQLDALARWYHQTHDAGREGEMYPAPLGRSKVWTFSTPSTLSSRSDLNSKTTKQEGKDASGKLVSLDTKRRRWGRFIGLRACESPTTTAPQDGDSSNNSNGTENGDEKREEEAEENVEEKMDREWRRAMRRAEEEKASMQKIWRGRF